MAAAPARAPQFEPARLQQVRAEQTRILYANAPIGTTSALLAGIVLAATLLADAQGRSAPVWAWFAALAIAYAAHLLLCAVYARTSPPQAGWRFWSGCFALASLAEGLVWGLGALLLIGGGGLGREMPVMLVVSAIAAGSCAAFGPRPPAFFAFLLPAMLPYLLFALGQGDSLHLGMAALDVFFVVSIGVIGLSTAGIIADALNLRFENEGLVVAQRALTLRAEAASIAKSRFLAAASHDLRQPIHALGMFAAALGLRELDAGARDILARVESSIAALDGLFSALLDISKIDAGAIEAHAAAFEIQPLLARIVEEQQAAAAAKGIGLRLMPCSLAVETDPLLLERILRNLLANAVRFTGSGRVLVGCRRGARLRIEVLDTGPGIAPAEQERIFEEFHQVGNPGRDRAQGLGLGLAIVRRLAALLDCGISLRSAPGAGSRFCVSVPLAARPVPAPSAVAETHAAVGGLVLIIDDEAMILEGMAAVLQGWGFATLAAGSCAEMLERIAHCYEVPRLILCDFRLRDGQSGIDAIRDLQAQYEEPVPGILVTGDTAPQRIRESRDSGFALLHKPVAPARLRAAIDAVLRAATPPAAPAPPPGGG